jgi:hypothetical protein
MKLLIFLSTFSILLLSASDCSKKIEDPVRFKGKLEIKGICMNYTISLLEGEIDTSLIAENWTDEITSKSYDNVFRLGSPCTFPASINQGDEFYFIIDNTSIQNCAVCMAYYPTPPKIISIKVLNK